MTDFLGRLADRALGMARVARPILPSAYAPQPEAGSTGFVETREFVDDEGPMDELGRQGASGPPQAADAAAVPTRGALSGPVTPSDREVSAKPEHSVDAVRPVATQRVIARRAASGTRAPRPADETRPTAARREEVDEGTPPVNVAATPSRLADGRRRRAATTFVASAFPVAPIGTGQAAESLPLRVPGHAGPNGGGGSPVLSSEAMALPSGTPTPTRRTLGDLNVDTAGAGTSVPATRDGIAHRRSAGEAAPGDTAPTINVTIGRVEVRSPAPPVPQQPATAWKPPHLSLDEFLARRPGR